MGMSDFRKMGSCVLLSMLPGSCFAADSRCGHALMRMECGLLNGAHVPTSSAILPRSGQTRLTLGKYQCAGSEHYSSRRVPGEFEGASLKVEHGGVSVSTSRLWRPLRRCAVAPVSTHWTEFNVTDRDGT